MSIPGDIWIGFVGKLWKQCSAGFGDAACDLSTEEAEAGRLRVWGQAGLQGEWASISKSKSKLKNKQSLS